MDFANMSVNLSKIEQLKKLQVDVRIGGKGTARRKKKVVHRTSNVDEKKLQTSLKKMRAAPLPGVDEANMFMADNTVMHFSAPKVQLALGSNMVIVSGAHEKANLKDLMPRVMPQLGPEQVVAFCNLSGAHGKGSADVGRAGNDSDDDDDSEDEIPTLVEDFEAVNIKEEKVIKNKK